MNRIFKIVFNRLRGKMMVVNEATSSTQGGAARSSRLEKKTVPTARLSLSAMAFAVSAALFAASASAATLYEWHSNSQYSIETLLQQKYHYQFNQNEDLVIRDSGAGSHNGGYGLIDAGQIFHIGADFGSNNDWNHTVTFSGQPDFMVRGTDLTTSTTQQGGLAVIAVNGGENAKLTGNVWFDASGYVLVSASNIELSGPIGTFAPDTPPRDAPSLVIDPDKNVEKTILVFQNQNSGNGSFSIKDIFDTDDRLANGGIYINTQDSDITFNGAKLKSHEDIVVDLGNKDLKLTGSTKVYSGRDSNDRAYTEGTQKVLINKEGDSKVVMGGTSGIVTEQLMLTNGAEIFVEDGSTASIGTITAGASGTTMTLGGSGFSVGSLNEDSTTYAEGLINSAGNLSLNGGQYFFSASNTELASTEDVGLRSASSMTISNGAVVEAIDGAHIFANPEAKASDTNSSLTVTGQGTSVSIGGRRGSQFSDSENYYQAIFNTFGTDDKFDSFGAWSILGANYDTLITNGASVTLNAAGVLMSKYHQIHAYSGTEIHTKTENGDTDPAAIHANGSISIDGIGSTYDGLLWVESGQGNIQMLGGRFDITPSRNRVGLISQEGSLKLVSIDNGTEELNGSMEISNKGQNDKGALYAKKDIFVHGDKNLSISNTVLRTDGTGSLSTIQLTSGGVITLDNAYITTVTINGNTSNLWNENYKPESNVKLGNIKIFGATAQNYQQGAASTSFVESEIGAAINITNSKLYGNQVQIGNSIGGAETITITNSEIFTNGDGFGTGYAYNIKAQGDLSITNSEVHYSDGNNGTTNISSVKGDITLNQANINDNAYKESGRGVLSVFIGESIDSGATGTITLTNDSRLDDDNIRLGAGLETIEVIKSIIHVDNETGNSLMLKAQSLTLSDHSSIGENENDGRDSSGTALTGAVSIDVPTITLKDNSFITSTGEVDIKSNSITMTADEDGNASWIKGQSVNIANSDRGDNKNLSITGGEIKTTGNEGNDINISSAGNLKLEGISSVDAGKGDVNISMGLGTTDSVIHNTNITGQTISFDGIADKDNANKDLGVIKVTGSSNITAGSDATGNAFGGKININSGAHVWVSSGSSIEANPAQSGETDTGIDIAGGKLTIEGGATVTSGDDVNITQGGAVDFVGKDSSNPGKLVAGGSVSVGGDKTTVGQDNQGGSINVGTGTNGNAVGVIVTGDSNDDKLTIGTGGKVNIANGSHLVVTTDGSTATTGTGSGLTITGSNNSGSNGATVNIAGGTLITDQITTDDNAKLEETMVVGSDSYLAIDDPFKDQTDSSADKELSFAIDPNASNIVLDISNGNLSKEEIKVVAGALGDKGSLLVSGSTDDVEKDAMTQKEWSEHFGLGSDNTSLVVADKGVITENNQISQGGGSWLVGQDDGPVNITGDENGTGVFITGSQDELDEGEKFEAVHDGNGNALGVHVDANNTVTIGSSGSYGGNLSAGIEAENGAQIDFIGGEWDVGSITGNGDLIIEDKSEHASGTVVNVDGPLEANGWEMTGETTGLNTKGDAHFTGSGLLTGGASADIGGALTVDNSLTLKDNAQLTVAGDSSIKGGLTVSQGTSYETTGGADLTVTGGDSNFAGTVSVSGDYSNNDGKTTVTGSTTIDGTANTDDLIVGDDNFTGSGTNGSFVAGTTTVGGQFTAHEDSSTTINGDFSVAEDSTINAGAQVTVNGEASFTGGLHVTENGVFKNTSKDKGTTVDDHLILEAGSSVMAGSSFELADSDVTIGNSSSASTNNTLSGHISATDHINFGSATDGITFSGANAGTDAHHIQAGAGGLFYEDGASHLFTKTDSDPEGGIVTGVVNVGVESSLTMDPNNYGDSSKASLVMNDSLKLANDNSMVIVGTLPNGVAQPSNAGIYLGTDSYFDLNASQFNSGDPIVTVGDNETTGTIYLSEGTTININNWTLGTDGYLTVNFDVLGDSDKDILDFLNSDNALYNFWYEGDRLGMGLGSASASGADNKFADVVDAVLASNSENAMKQSLVTGVFSKSSGFMTQLADGSWVVNDLGNQRLQDVLGLPIAAGSFNVAYDAMSQMGNSLMSHMIEPVTSKSTAVWADVISTRNRADTLFGDSGYSADIYAGVLGADQWVTPDTLLGAAVTIGTADAQGEGASMRIDNDAKFYGIFGYAMHRLHENLVASFDVGYMNVENDIDTDVNYGGKGDTKVLTASARLDMTLYRSETLSVTPHFGIRYANFDIDTINQTATNDINVIETPIGVTVKGKTSYKGWTINPNVDVSVVPQMADRKAKIWNSGEAFEQDILDPALVNSTIGVTGHKGDWSYGVNYRFGVGGNDRQNHSFIGNIRYQF